MFKGPIARATIRTSFVLGLRLVVQAGTLLLVARMLGPEQFGAFAGIAALAMLLGVLASFGTNWILLSELTNNSKQRDLVLTYALPTTLICGISLLVAFLILSNFWLDFIGVSFLLLLLIGITETLLQPLLGLVATEHYAHGHIARAQLLQVFPLFLRLITALIILTLQVKAPLPTYVICYTATSIAALVFSYKTLSEPWPSWQQWRRPSQAELRESFGYAIINITKSGPSELDKILSARLLSLDAAGVYSASARVVGAITLPITAMTLSALPRLFRDNRNDWQKNNRLLGWMFIAAFGYSILLATVLWFVAPLFSWFFGNGYSDLTEVVRLLCFAVPGMALRLVAGNALMAIEKPWMRAAFEIAGLSSMAIIGIALIPILGSQGMPLALIGSEWVMALIGILILLKVNQAKKQNKKISEYI